MSRIIFAPILLVLTVSCYSARIAELEKENEGLKSELAEMKQLEKENLNHVLEISQRATNRLNVVNDSITKIRSVQYVKFFSCIPGLDEVESKLFVELIKQDLAPYKITVERKSFDSCRVDVFDGRRIKSITTRSTPVELRQQIKGFLNAR